VPIGVRTPGWNAALCRIDVVAVVVVVAVAVVVVVATTISISTEEWIWISWISISISNWISRRCRHLDPPNLTTWRTLRGFAATIRGLDVFERCFVCRGCCCCCCCYDCCCTCRRRCHQDTLPRVPPSPSLPPWIFPRLFSRKESTWTSSYPPKTSTTLSLARRRRDRSRRRGTPHSRSHSHSEGGRSVVAPTACRNSTISRDSPPWQCLWQRDSPREQYHRRHRRKRRRRRSKMMTS